MRTPAPGAMTDLIGSIPYRMALAGGWIDQPFVSRLNTSPPGSMVVVSIEPEFRWMDRSGMGTSTRNVALRLWPDGIPARNPLQLVRELYAAENSGKAEPSGSQDMAGLIFPGISRLDYDARFEGGSFPCHVESCNEPDIASWLESVLKVVPVAQRPPDYSPLGARNLDQSWICRLGRAGRDCFNAIVAKDLARLGESMNECMRCWEAILPGTVRHPAITVDLAGLLQWYQSRCAGAMYSGCGGGYLYVASAEPIPGSLRVRIRVSQEAGG